MSRQQWAPRSKLDTLAVAVLGAVSVDSQGHGASSPLPTVSQERMPMHLRIFGGTSCRPELVEEQVARESFEH